MDIEKLVDLLREPFTPADVKEVVDSMLGAFVLGEPEKNLVTLVEVMESLKAAECHLGTMELSKLVSQREEWRDVAAEMHEWKGTPVYSPNGEHRDIVQGVIDRIEIPDGAADFLMKHIKPVPDYLDRGRAILKEVWLGVAEYNSFYEGKKSTIAWRDEIMAFMMKKPAMRHFFHAAYGTKKGQTPFNYDIARG